MAGDSVAGFDDLARLDAAGADVQTLRRAVDDGTDALDVRVPATLGATVRVRHRHAPRRVLPTDFADSCHRDSRLPAGSVSPQRPAEGHATKWPECARRVTESSPGRGRWTITRNPGCPPG